MEDDGRWSSPHTYSFYQIYTPISLIPERGVSEDPLAYEVRRSKWVNNQIKRFQLDPSEADLKRAIEEKDNNNKSNRYLLTSEEKTFLSDRYDSTMLSWSETLYRIGFMYIMSPAEQMKFHLTKARQFVDADMSVSSDRKLTMSDSEILQHNYEYNYDHYTVVNEDIVHKAETYLIATYCCGSVALFNSIKEKEVMVMLESLLWKMRKQLVKEVDAKDAPPAVPEQPQESKEDDATLLHPPRGDNMNNINEKEGNKSKKNKKKKNKKKKNRKKKTNSKKKKN